MRWVRRSGRRATVLELDRAKLVLELADAGVEELWPALEDDEQRPIGQFDEDDPLLARELEVPRSRTPSSMNWAVWPFGPPAW